MSSSLPKVKVKLRIPGSLRGDHGETTSGTGSGLAGGGTCQDGHGVGVDLRRIPVPLMKKLLRRYGARLVEELQKKDVYEYFKEPVSVDLVPDYREVIKSPMDLGTVRKKLSRGDYRTVHAFRRDLDLIWDNCCLFNDKKTDYYRKAAKLRAETAKMVPELEKTLEGIDLVKEFGEQAVLDMNSVVVKEKEKKNGAGLSPGEGRIDNTSSKNLVKLGKAGEEKRRPKKNRESGDDGEIKVEKKLKVERRISSKGESTEEPGRKSDADLATTSIPAQESKSGSKEKKGLKRKREDKNVDAQPGKKEYKQGTAKDPKKHSASTCNTDIIPTAKIEKVVPSASEPSGVLKVIMPKQVKEGGADGGPTETSGDLVKRKRRKFPPLRPAESATRAGAASGSAAKVLQVKPEALVDQKEKKDVRLTGVNSSSAHINLDEILPEPDIPKIFIEEKPTSDFIGVYRNLMGLAQASEYVDARRKPPPLGSLWVQLGNYKDVRETPTKEEFHFSQELDNFAHASAPSAKALLTCILNPDQEEDNVEEMLISLCTTGFVGTRKENPQESKSMSESTSPTRKEKIGPEGHIIDVGQGIDRLLDEVAERIHELRCLRAHDICNGPSDSSERTQECAQHVIARLTHLIERAPSGYLMDKRDVSRAALRMLSTTVKAENFDETEFPRSEVSSLAEVTEPEVTVEGS